MYIKKIKIKRCQAFIFKEMLKLLGKTLLKIPKESKKQKSMNKKIKILKLIQYINNLE